MSGLGFTCWGASVAIAFSASFCTVDYASAQITPDGTLPNNTSSQERVTPLTLLEKLKLAVICFTVLVSFL
jgi:hypothetical protein